MAYDEFLADRIRRFFADQKVPTEEKKMMGGLCFMVDDKMCCGVVGDELMGRIGEETEKEMKELEGARPMDFTGRRMKGYVFVSAEGVDNEDDLDQWLEACLAFNPQAKSSKN